MFARAIKLGVLLFLYAIHVGSHANVPNIFTPSSDEFQPLAAQLTYLEEEPGQVLEIDQVVGKYADDFKPLIKQNLGFYYGKVMWLRFRIDLTNYREPFWFLTQNHIHAGSVTLYYPDAGQFTALQISADDSVPKRLFWVQNYLFKVPTSHTNPTTYYLRYDPKGRAHIVDLSWAGTKGIIEHTHDKHIVIGIFFGGLGMLWLYNCVIFLYLRSRDYLYYVYYLGCFIATFFYLNGFAPFLIRSSAIYEPIFAACAYGAIHGMTLFARQFLSLSTTAQCLDRYLKVCQHLLAIGGIAALILPIGIPYPVLNYLIFLTVPMLVAAGIIRWKQGDVLAKLYCTGWFVFTAALLIYCLRTFGILPSTPFTTYAIQMASVWEAIIFALALAYRLKLASQEAAMAKNAFLGMISHELRTPLQTIISAIDLLALRKSTRPKDEDVMKTLRQAAQHLEMQMRDLTDYARLDSGKDILRKTAFNASQLIIQTANEFRFTAERKGLQFDVDVQASHHFVLSDALRIQQILNNLIINAIKYTERGSIQVRLRYRRETEKLLTLVISVQDSGIGISNRNIRKLFKPFTQITQSHAKSEGVGMGLAIVHRLVELFHGTVTVDSLPGKGSTFEVCIPAQEVEVVGAEITAVSTCGHTRAYDILLVDDTPEVGNSLRDILEQLGYRCEVVTRGKEAVECIKHKRYDAVLLDVNMPDMNGFCVATAIRNTPGSNQQVPIIWISATAPQIVTAEERNLFTHFLEKPIHSQRLEAMLTQILECNGVSNSTCDK